MVERLFYSSRTSYCGENKERESIPLPTYSSSRNRCVICFTARSSRRYHIHWPLRCLTTSPAFSRIFMWCDTVGCESRDLHFDVARAQAGSFTDRTLFLLLENAQDAAASGVRDSAQLLGKIALSVLRIHDHQYSHEFGKGRTTKTTINISSLLITSTSI